MYQLDENGRLASRTADYVIGEASLYGRRNSPEIATRSEGSLISGIAYDNVNHRLFARDSSVIAWGPNGRLLVFDVHPDRMVNGPQALAVFGQPDFTTRRLGGVGPQKLASINGTVLDEKHQRLFVSDGDNNRVLIWDVDPARLTETPNAMAVIGQPDFYQNEPHVGASGLNDPGSIHYDAATDRLFVVDGGNHRILTFDVTPQSLETGMSAKTVIGQPDFNSNQPGVGAARFDRPSRLSFDDLTERLFVADGGNQRVLVFDVRPAVLDLGSTATHVLGQDTFGTSERRVDLRKLAPGQMILNRRQQQLMVNEGTVANRTLVFDVHPDRIENNPDAMAVLFQTDFEKSERRTSQIYENSPRPFLDEDTNTLYVASGYPGGNRVLLMDMSPGQVTTGMPAFDLIGHYDDEGKPNFDARAAYGRINDRFIYPRGVALDPVDHRLFVNDQYNNRVLMFELDAENRIADRVVDVVLGQPDAYTGQLREISARTLQIPLALAYDIHSKQLFVGDGWNNRVMVFDAHPDRLRTFDEAVAALGQRDFKSDEPSVGPDRLNFGVSWGRGIQSAAPTPLALEVDTNHHRLFVSDGINHRVLAFDIRPGMVKTGASAIGVLGQRDLEQNDPTPKESSRVTDSLGVLGARVVSGRAPVNNRGFDTPSGLVYDVNHDRLFVVDGNNSRVMAFDAAPSRWQDGQESIAILGQMNDTEGDEVRLDRLEVGEDKGRRRMRMPSGLTYDTANDRLLVNDKGNDRILFFEAHPDALETGMAASGVIGQKDYVSRIAGNGEQEQLLDPREITFDPEHQRLYVTDSFWARLMVFDLPRAERSVAIPANTTMSYRTLDAWNGRDQSDQDIRHAWRGSLKSEGGPAPGAMLVYYNTHRELDVLAKRRSRLLLSETSVVTPQPQTKTVFYVDVRQGQQVTLIVTNPESREVQVTLRLSYGDHVRTAKVSLRANGFRAKLLEIFDPDEWVVEGTLEVSAPQPVAAMVLTHTLTERGETLVLASKGSSEWDGRGPLVIPGLKAGGGYRSELVLINPDESVMEGVITVFGRDSGAVSGASLPVPYHLAPGDVFRWSLESSYGVTETSYGVIRPTVGTAPSAMARVRLLRGTLLLSETEIPARVSTQNAWFSIDTLPSILRHGESQMLFTFANATRTPATVRLTLFDELGKEHGRWERILPAFSQRVWSLGELFNVQKHRGAVRLWTDVPLALSAQRVTRNLRGESVENELGYVETAALTSQGLEFPAIFDGQGLATEIMLINPSNETAKGQMIFVGSEGQSKDIILR